MSLQEFLAGPSRIRRTEVNENMRYEPGSKQAINEGIKITSLLFALCPQEEERREILNKSLPSSFS